MASLSRLTLMGPWLSIFIFILRLVFMFRPNRALSEVIVPGRERDFSSMTKKNERVGSFKRGEWGFVEPISSSSKRHYYTDFTKYLRNFGTLCFSIYKRRNKYNEFNSQF